MRCLSALAALAVVFGCVACNPKAAPSPGAASSGGENKSAATGSARDAKVGPFTVKVPADWPEFSPAEASSLRRQFDEQRSQIHRQYSGGRDDPSGSVDLAVFHIPPDQGAFILVSVTVPPQADLVNVLKSQAQEKADWGVAHGYIRKYLGLVPIDDDQFSGFIIKTVGKEGDIEVTGGLEHKKLKNTLVQLTLISPKSWDQDKAEKTLAEVLKSLALTRQ